MQIAEPEGYRKKGSAKQPRAAFADGTALPAKRPRTSNTDDPDAARSNRRTPAITDFFNNIPQATNKGVASDSQVLPGGEDKTQNEQDQQTETKSGSSGPLRSSAANGTADNVETLASAEIYESQSAARQGDLRQSVQHVKDAEPGAERKRQMMADAAMRRLGSQQHNDACSDPQIAVLHGDSTLDIGKVPDKARISVVIDLVDADEVGLQQQVAQPSSQPDHQVVGGGQQPSCPICRQIWSTQMSNVEVNQHIDKCLSAQML